MLLRIDGELNSANVEAELRRIVATPETNLQIPVHPQEWWLGGESGLIGLAITWARINEQRAAARARPVDNHLTPRTYTETTALVTHVGPAENPEVQLKTLARRMFGFVTLMMTPEVLDREMNRERSLRREAYEQCRKVVEMMYRPVSQFALGNKIFLISVDHSTRAEIPWLYTHAHSIADRIAFTTLAKELINKTSEGDHSRIPLASVSKVGGIIHELFKNTHEWACTDEHGRPWRRSVRGLSAQRHSWTKAELVGIAKESPALREYLDSLFARTTSDRLRFIELTVFDSGIGLARQWLKAELTDGISITDEYEACLACLMKHESSSRMPGKGLGLAEVMATMAELDGFLKIRTGRLSLYRDFVTSPLRGPSLDVELLDFVSSSKNLRTLAPIFGTHFQLLIPIL